MAEASLRQDLNRAAGTIRKQAYVWPLAALALLGPVLAAVTYDPTSTDKGFNVLWATLLALVAEGGLVYAFGANIRGEPVGLVDAVMSPVSLFGKMLVTRAIPLSLAATFTAVVMIMSPVIALDHSLLLVVAAVGLPVLLATQVWTFLGQCGILVHDYSVGEALTHAWRIGKGSIRRLAGPVLVFLVLDLLLTGILLATGATSEQSALEYTVTEEMADRNALLGGRAPTEPGQYFSITRPVTGYVAAALRGHGPSLFVVPFYLTGSGLAALLAAVAVLPFLVLRALVFTLVYTQIADPIPKLDDRSLRVFRRK